jgi:Na+-driven multidrug efflux pump
MTRAATARAAPTLAQSTPPSSVLAAFITALAAFFAAGAKTATASKTLSYKDKKTLKHAFSFSLILSLSLSFSLSFSLYPTNSLP